MIDCLIIHPKSLWYEDRPQINNGAITLASYLDTAGVSVRLVDGNASYRRYRIRDYMEWIARYDPATIGVSVCMMNAFHAYTLVNELRRAYPKTLIIGGGLHSYDSADEMMESPFDIVVKGEGELPATAILETVKARLAPDTRVLMQDPRFIQDIHQIPGLLIRSGNEIIDTGSARILENLDDLPLINYELANLEEFVQTASDYELVATSFNFQRGCPFHCDFCKSNVLASKVRNNSAHYMINAIQQRYVKYRIKNVWLYDPNFTLDLPRMCEFCEKVIASQLSGKLTFAVQSSVTIPLDDDDVCLLKRAGVNQVMLGVERFDDEFRKTIHKAGTRADVARMLELLHKHDIITIVFLLFNFPYETIKTLNKEVEYLDQYMPYIDFYFINYLVPVPGTAIYKLPGDFKRWYLKKEFVCHRMTYYEMSFLVSGLAVDNNFFKLAPETLKRIRALKEEYHCRSGLRLSTSAVFKICFQIDLFLGKGSYWIARLSPILEHVVYFPLKGLRCLLVKKIYKRFILSRKSVSADAPDDMPASFHT